MLRNILQFILTNETNFSNQSVFDIFLKGIFMGRRYDLITHLSKKKTSLFNHFNLTILYEVYLHFLLHLCDLNGNVFYHQYNEDLV